MESHTDTATVEAPVAEASEAVESLPQETTQDGFLDALDAALSNISENPVSGDVKKLSYNLKLKEQMSLL